MKVLLIGDYADYSYIIAIVLWASVLMDGGINNLVFNKGLKDDLKDINTLFTARFFLSMLIIMGVFLFFYFTKPDIKLSALLYAFIIYFSSSSVFIKMLSRGKEYHNIDLTVILLEPVLKLLLFGVVYIAIGDEKWELWMLMAIYLVASIISFTVNYLLLSKKYVLKIQLRSFKLLYRQLQATLNLSKYYLLYYFLYAGMMRIDVIFIEKYTSKVMLAWFSAAIMFYGVMQLFFFTIITSKFKKVYADERKAIFIILLLLLGVVLATNLLSGFVYNLLLSEEYHRGNNVLNGIVWALIPSVINYYIMAKFNFENKTKLNAVFLFFPLLFKIVVYYSLKPQEISMYQHTYVISEYLLLCLFSIYFLYRNRIRKSIF